MRSSIQYQPIPDAIADLSTTVYVGTEGPWVIITMALCGALALMVTPWMDRVRSADGLTGGKGGNLKYGTLRIKPCLPANSACQNSAGVFNGFMISPLTLTAEEQGLLNGDEGDALKFALEVVVRAAEVMGAKRLRPANFVHVDACHYYGQAHLDFSRFFLERGARFPITAWTNTVPVSLIQEELRDGADPDTLADSRRLAEDYLKLGAEPVWTCSPYHLPDGPGFGDHIIVGESNAVAYYNSVVGARTNKYGDFLDVCAGLTGRVPDAGLHRDKNRKATIVVDVAAFPESLIGNELFCHVLGHHLGRTCGNAVPVITGLPLDTPNDSLKGLGAAAAAAGGVALFHAVGLTPEAATLDEALQEQEPAQVIKVEPVDLMAARDALSSARPGPLAMVSLGTPHFSLEEFARLHHQMGDRKVHTDVHFYVSTSRYVAAAAAERGWLENLESAGVDVLVDTCTYFSPAIRGCRGRVMTNSAKWAYYAPGMLPVEVAFGSLADCVESAIAGEVRRDPRLWSSSTWGL
ncbi:MAG: aconitase X catalytic domain-containing protein [Pseudomonadota bacterium]